MPTVARIGPYRIYFFSQDRLEPPHVHVDRDASTVEFWLVPVSLAYNLGFRPKELRDIRRVIVARAAEFLEAWNDEFNA